MSGCLKEKHTDFTYCCWGVKKEHSGRMMQLSGSLCNRAPEGQTLLLWKRRGGVGEDDLCWMHINLKTAFFFFLVMCHFYFFFLSGALPLCLINFLSLMCSLYLSLCLSLILNLLHSLLTWFYLSKHFLSCSSKQCKTRIYFTIFCVADEVWQGFCQSVTQTHTHTQQFKLSTCMKSAPVHCWHLVCMLEIEMCIDR